jgi:hypothetical protein
MANFFGAPMSVLARISKTTCYGPVLGPADLHHFDNINPLITLWLITLGGSHSNLSMEEAAYCITLWWYN